MIEKWWETSRAAPLAMRPCLVLYLIRNSVACAVLNGSAYICIYMQIRWRARGSMRAGFRWCTLRIFGMLHWILWEKIVVVKYRARVRVRGFGYCYGNDFFIQKIFEIRAGILYDPCTTITMTTPTINTTTTTTAIYLVTWIGCTIWMTWMRWNESSPSVHL